MRTLMKFGGCVLVLLFLGSGCSRRTEPVNVITGERVVSLAPNLTEITCAIGAGKQLVGRTSACDYPPEIVETVPVIGGFGRPCLDSLIKVNPTLVLDVDLDDESVGKLIEQVGLKRERIKCSALDDIPHAILAVGELLNCRESARTLADTISRRVAELRADAGIRRERSEGPSVYVEIWSDPLMTVGGGSFVSDLVSLAGGRNIGDAVRDKDYFPVSPEWVISRDPDVIVCLYMSDAETIRDAVAGRIGWAQIKAVENHRVYGGLDSSLVLRPGPRVLEGIEVLRQRIESPPRLPTEGEKKEHDE